jgi:hypothetical protein
MQQQGIRTQIYRYITSTVLPAADLQYRASFLLGCWGPRYGCFVRLKSSDFVGRREVEDHEESLPAAAVGTVGADGGEGEVVGCC